MKLAVAAILSLFAVVHAGDTGSIEGVVCDSYGTPLVGATVMIEGTAYGDMTNGNGEYSITGLPAGSYTVFAQMVGMSRATRTGISVTAGESTRVDFGGSRDFAGTEDVASLTEIPDEAVWSGRVYAIGEDGILGDLPLEHTSVEIDVSGNLQRAIVRQVYGNPIDEPIEAVYTFPLPQDGAVDRMDMWVGEKRVHGQVYERSQARQIYEDALSEGRTASLLEQERPNIFTQNVGNVLPGDSITIEISYVASVGYDDASYEIVFPMVVGPRFIPGEPAGESSRGWSPPTDIVPDADRITPHVVPKGTRTGYDIDLAVNIDVGIPVQALESHNHDVEWDIDYEGRATVTLVDKEEIPNKDFVLSYTTLTNSIETGVLAHNLDFGGHFMLIIQPAAEIAVDEVTSKELFFVVDCSGSMSGRPIEVAKETVRQFVAGMNPDDSFQIIRFSESASTMSPTPLENEIENVVRGLDYIDGLHGSGGTMMIEGIRAAVGYPIDPKRVRFVIFLTDGFIGNEAQILGELRDNVDDHIRLFSIGIGSSPNRYLIEGLAEEGRGASYYVGLNDEPSLAVREIYHKLNNPYLVGIEIDWGDLDVYELYPERLPDLFAEEPLVLVGRYDEGCSENIRISGSIAGFPWSTVRRVTLPAEEYENDAIATLWARRKIHELTRQMYNRAGRVTEEPGIVYEITQLALDYQIMSDYTSFVAVTEEVRTDPDGNPITVEVPLNMPEGVTYEGVFGETTSGGLVPQRVGEIYIEVTAMDEEADSVIERLHAVQVLSIGPLLGLRMSQIRASIQEKRERMLFEYSDLIVSLEEGQEIPVGIITFSLSIEQDGIVQEVRVVENGTGSAELADTIASILKEITIPAPPEGAGTIEVSIRFKKE